MPQQVVFPCPNCGASQSVDDSTISTQCQFCGNTIATPAALRGAGQQPSAAYASSPAAPMSGVGLGYGQDGTKLGATGDAMPAGAKPEAVSYYVPMMSPVMPDTNRIWRGVMGLNIAITLGIFAFTGCTILFVFLVIGLTVFPSLWGFGQVLSQLNH
jgi:hypothetical protein